MRLFSTCAASYGIRSEFKSSDIHASEEAEMKNRSGLGVTGTLLVAIVALVFGAVGGAVAGSKMSTTKIVRETVSTADANPAAYTVHASAPMSWTQVAAAAGPATTSPGARPSP